MIGNFSQFISDNHLADKSSKTLLAVSGGVDSAVMADMFYKAGFSFGMAHANFQLRGEESERDEAFVRQLAEKYKVEIFIKRFSTSGYAKKKKISIQVAARELRYQWFEELLVKNGYDVVATAHHLDDQVETFLINLARGTGIAGLHGIPVKQGKIIRPLLFAWREEILDYAFDNQVSFVEDSSNITDKYTRNRIRHHVVPHLEKINPGFKKGLNETIKIIQETEIIYKQSITDTRNSILEKRGNNLVIPVHAFFSLDPIKAYAFELLSPFGFNLANIDNIISLKDAIPGKEVLSSTHRLVKDRNELIILPRIDIPCKSEYELNFSDLEKGFLYPADLSFEILDKKPENLKLPPDEALLDLEKLDFPLKIRKWKRGDAFVPFGMSKLKKLSDFFIDLKYSKIDKENQWLLCSGNDIVWIIGQRIDERYKVEKESLKILKIRVDTSRTS